MRRKPFEPTIETNSVFTPYPHEEVVNRYQAWVETANESYSWRQRNDAWNSYVDARDSLAEGTTAEKQSRMVH